MPMLTMPAMPMSLTDDSQTVFPPRQPGDFPAGGDGHGEEPDDAGDEASYASSERQPTATTTTGTRPGTRQQEVDDPPAAEEQPAPDLSPQGSAGADGAAELLANTRSIAESSDPYQEDTKFEEASGDEEYSPDHSPLSGEENYSPDHSPLSGENYSPDQSPLSADFHLPTTSGSYPASNSEERSFDEPQVSVAAVENTSPEALPASKPPPLAGVGTSIEVVSKADDNEEKGSSSDASYDEDNFDEHVEESEPASPTDSPTRGPSDEEWRNFGNAT